MCYKHNEILIAYCKYCKLDLCLSCINSHKNHKIIRYEDKMIEIEELRKK